MSILASQSNSALCSSSVNYASASFGGHPFTKSVVSSPSDSARLERAFHFTNPYAYIELVVLYKSMRRMRDSSGFKKWNNTRNLPN